MLFNVQSLRFKVWSSSLRTAGGAFHPPFDLLSHLRASDKRHCQRGSVTKRGWTTPLSTFIHPSIYRAKMAFLFHKKYFALSNILQINNLCVSPEIIKSLHKKSQCFDYEDFIKNEKNQKVNKKQKNRQKIIKKIEKKLNFVKNYFKN